MQLLWRPAKIGLMPQSDKPSVLHSVANLLERPVTKDQLLKAMVDQVQQELDAERGTLYLIDAHTSELVSRVAHLPELSEIRLPMGTGVAGHVAKTGKVVWKDLKISYNGPLIIHHDTLITNGSNGYGLELMTGKKIPGWKWTRTYGCNTAIASEHLLTFRSGAAGYYDLTGKSGTGNFGGFKSGCTSNLIAADGVLNAPDYTRTCTCSYQNQSSLAMVHMPGVETWTYAGFVRPGSSVGLNFGAPGDRLADNGTFWRDVGVRGIGKSKSSGKSKSVEPYVSVRIKGDKAECFNHHSSTFARSPHAWVGASGLVGASSITINTDIRPVAVRLYFAEPDASAKPGRRVFSVSLNGKKVLKNFDVLSAAGGPRKVIAKAFKYSATGGPIEITLRSASGRTLLCGIELLVAKE